MSLIGNATWTYECSGPTLDDMAHLDNTRRHLDNTRRHLGTTDGLVTSAIGFGCMGLSQGYGPADDEVSIRTIHAALDTGIILFDTAMSYGRGHNETLVGQALHHHPEAQVATKFGIVRRDDGVALDAHPDRIRGYCEASLRRLGRDVIDLYYLHRVDPSVPLADSLGAMSELVESGLVRHLGVSEVTPEQLEQAHAVHPIAAVQFEWSLMWREPEHALIPAARRHGIGLVPYSPLGRGLLTATLAADQIAAGPFRAGDPRFSGSALADNLIQVRALRALADSIGITTGQLALAWLHAQGDDVVPIPGTRNPARAVENAAAADICLDEQSLRVIADAVPDHGWAGDRQSFAVPVTTRSRDEDVV